MLSRHVKTPIDDVGDIAKMWSQGEYPTKAIKREDYTHFQAIIDVLFEDETIAGNYTKKELAEELQELLADISERPQFDKDEAEQEAHDLVKRLREGAKNLDSWRILLPILNLKIEKPPVKVGNVKLLEFEGQVYKEWLEKEEKIWNDNPYYSQETAEANFEFFKKQYDSILQGKTCAEIEIKRRFKRAKEKGVQGIKEALSVIKLYWGKNDDKRRSYFGLPGDFVLSTDDSSNSLVIGRKEKKNKKEFYKAGALQKFELTEDRLSHMKEYYFDKFNDILTKDNPTELEEKVLACIYWFGQGVDTALPKKDQEKACSGVDLEFFKLQERFLKMVVALEALLIIGRERKKENIAKRGAYLLDKGDDRIDIYRKIKDFYNIRSRIVHEGLAKITFNEVYQLLYGVRSIIFNFLQEMNSKKLKTEDDFKEWVDNNVETVNWN